VNYSSYVHSIANHSCSSKCGWYNMRTTHWACKLWCIRWRCSYCTI